jgi:hypothetical protein
MSWTIGSGTIAAGTSATWWFSWGGNGDMGPQLIQAEPTGTSGELATTQLAEGLGNGHITYFATMQNQGSTACSFQWRGGGF